MTPPSEMSFNGKKWQPAPVLLPGKFQWQRSLVGLCGVAKSWTQLNSGAHNGKTRLETWTELSQLLTDMEPLGRKCAECSGGGEGGDLASIWLCRKPFLRKEELTWSQRVHCVCPNEGLKRQWRNFCKERAQPVPWPGRPVFLGHGEGDWAVLLHANGETEAQPARVPRSAVLSTEGLGLPRWELSFQPPQDGHWVCRLWPACPGKGEQLSLSWGMARHRQRTVTSKVAEWSSRFPAESGPYLFQFP